MASRDEGVAATVNRDPGLEAAWGLVDRDGGKGLILTFRDGQGAMHTWMRHRGGLGGPAHALHGDRALQEP